MAAIDASSVARFPEVLYIAGDSRSGSTLLQRLLTLQAGVIGLGEVRRLKNLVAASSECGCGAPLKDCEFWTEIARRLGRPLESLRPRAPDGFVRRRIGQAAAYAGVLLPAERRAAREVWSIHRAASEATGARLLVDSSKVALHLLYVARYHRQHLTAVFLVRDGRAVVWSKMRRTGIGAQHASRQWMNNARAMQLTEGRLRGVRTHRIRYEDLCLDPAKALGQIPGLGGPDGISTDMSSTAAVMHELGGSPAFRGGTSAHLKLDDRWRSEMPASALDEFERVAGTLNRNLGYT